MASPKNPKIYAGMLKRELYEVAERLGLRGVKKLRKDELIKTIQSALKRPKKTRGAEQAKKRPAASNKRARPPSKRPAADQKKKKQGDQKEPSGREKAVEGRSDVPPRPEPSGPMSPQSQVTAAKYRVGTAFPEEELRNVDSHLPGLPDGYGVDRLVLLPRNPAWLYAYWDLRDQTKDRARREGGQNLALRLYEDIDGRLEPMAEHWCREVSRSWYVAVPAPGRTYRAEVGYRTAHGSWLGLLRSNSIRVPPAAPSQTIVDEFMTILPDQELPRSEPTAATRPVEATASPSAPATVRAKTQDGVHQAAYVASQSTEREPRGSSGGALRAPTSPGGHVSSPRPSSPASAHRPPTDVPDDGFWLVADAELVVFGATEPGARLDLGGHPVRLRPDGTFSLRMAFPEGSLEIPITAAKADSDKGGKVTLRFERAPTEGDLTRRG